MTYSHEPLGYDCPFCRVIRESAEPATVDPGLVSARSDAVALISNRWWPNNPGHALVVPSLHTENLYEIPARFGHAVHDLVQQVAVAMRDSYACDGVSTRQHNEPAGGQDVWHFYVHVFPRYAGDHLYSTSPLPGFVSAEERRPYADRLKAALVR
ncbi:hypothetical protein GCM10011575_14450 [Microlunatus endophyticus]|uniref:HIT domain-containing protein n=1 Tax=Microlunatus endophyticus TaxID=1716077 RepID=A0A917W1C8_9ACTN|nr:HIT domain-containing protein [Microlunatus endophyticus]GGL57193.1 hypothetical protein GCM10011575_14450 [Microlunatus endophyticus]